MFSVRKRSVNVAAANVLTVRKRSDSNTKSGSSDAPRKLCSVRKRSANVAAANVFCSESEATATPKAAHRTPTGSFALCESEASATKHPVGTEINHTFW